MPRVKADKPRGRMSSYAYFVQTCREEHRKKHPEEAIAFAAFSKKCSDRWKVGVLACCLLYRCLVIAFCVIVFIRRCNVNPGLRLD